MKATDLLTEARQGSLWHGYDEKDNAIYAIKNNRMEGRTTHRWWPDKFRKDNEPGYRDSYWMKGISLTRDPKYAAKWGIIIFELDQGKLSQNYKIIPYDWGATIGTGQAQPRKESEEFLITKMDRDNYMDPIDDDEPEWKEFNYHRFMGPEGKPVEPLDKFLKGIWINWEGYQTLIDEQKTARNDSAYNYWQEQIDKLNQLKEHPKFKGYLTNKGGVKLKEDFNNDIPIINEVKPGTAGWINIKTGEYWGWYLTVKGDVYSHSQFFYYNVDKFNLPEEDIERLNQRFRSRGEPDDADETILSIASKNGWVRILHKVYDEEDTNIQGMSYREIAAAARQVNKQANIDYITFDVAGDMSTYGSLDGRAMRMFMKTGHIPRQSMMMENLNWAVGSNRSKAHFGYVQDSEENSVVWANISDIFRNTEGSQRLDHTDPTGGSNRIGNRVEKAIRHWKQEGYMDPAEIIWNDWKNSISFQDGRHRLVAAYQLGYQYAPVVIPREDLEEMRYHVRIKDIIKERKLDESVPIAQIRKDLYSRIMPKLKPIATQGGTAGQLRSTLDDVVQRTMNTTGRKMFGIPKDYDLDVKVRKVDGSDVNAWVDYPHGENAIVFTITIGDQGLKAAAKDVSKLARLVGYITEMVSHEAVHVYQRFQAGEKMNRRSGKLGPFTRKGFKIPKDDPNFWDRYLSDRAEIEAHAAETVTTLLNRWRGIDNPEEAWQRFRTEFTVDLTETSKLYWKYFGQYKDDRLRQKVWRKYLKKVEEQFRQVVEDQDASL